MYSTSFRSSFDDRLRLEFETGGIQGMGTTGVLFNTGKWATEKKTFHNLQSMTDGEFSLTGKIDYHDDGLSMFHLKFLKLYIFC